MNKKILFKHFILVIIMVLSFVLFNININASSEYHNILRADGNYVTYRGTNTLVEVPNTYNDPTTEYRGVWVSAFAGDIRGYKGSKAECQSELLAVLENMEKFNLNTVVFHIRTHNDAFYNTNLAPKSSYISNADFRTWDYLEWFIDECHQRGIEFHAWLNPYRISSTKTTWNDVKSKYQNYPFNPASKEENVLIGSSGAILDPGRPAVRDYLVDACMEVIEKYDVDAIHFDDYFYIDGIDDSKTFDLYKADFNTTSVPEFRRLQVDEFIKDLSEEMNKYNLENNRAVQLGISPSGVYRNGSYNTNYQYDSNGTLISPVASNSAGYAHYDSPLYSDTKKWIDNEWIDYITPQLYGSFENTGMAYADVLDWWTHVVKYKKVNLYTGIGVYQIGGTSDAGWYKIGLQTLCDSLLYNQKFEEVKGFCLYQYRSINNYIFIYNDKTNFVNTYLTKKALHAVSQRYTFEVDSVEDFDIYKGEGNYVIKCDSVSSADKYAIYKSTGEIDVNDPSQLVCIIGDSELITYTDYEENENVNYGIVAINDANETSKLVCKNSSEAKSELDFDFAKINDIDFNGTVASGAYLQFVFETADLYAGSRLTYKIYYSLDEENWELKDTVTSPNPTVTSVRFQFNSIMSPMYFKLVVENEFGQIESDVLKVDFRRVRANECLDYMYQSFTDDIKKLFEIGD